MFLGLFGSGGTGLGPDLKSRVGGCIGSDLKARFGGGTELEFLFRFGCCVRGTLNRGAGDCECCDDSSLSFLKSIRSSASAAVPIPSPSAPSSSSSPGVSSTGATFPLRAKKLSLLVKGSHSEVADFGAGVASFFFFLIALFRILATASSASVGSR